MRRAAFLLLLLALPADSRGRLARCRRLAQCLLTCCCCTLCIDDCKNTEHYCPNCGNFLGKNNA